MGGPEADREGLVQDVFCVVHRRLADSTGTIWRSGSIKLLDIGCALSPFVVGEALAVPTRSPRGARPPRIRWRPKKRVPLECVLRKLNESERAALVLLEIDGYSGAQIAQIQGVALNTVWARLHSARKKLKASLARIESRENGRRNARRERSVTVARPAAKQTP
jgi:predicted DNA-binding protein (UPF0251 family)